MIRPSAVQARFPSQYQPPVSETEACMQDVQWRNIGVRPRAHEMPSERTIAGIPMLCSALCQLPPAYLLILVILAIALSSNALGRAEANFCTYSVCL